MVERSNRFFAPAAALKVALLVVTFRRSHLWYRIAWPFVLFVLIGGAALAAWMQMLARHESVAVFTALARANAEFLKSARIPESPQTMSYLGRILNMQAFLSPRRGELQPGPAPELAAFSRVLGELQAGDGLLKLGGRYEAIAAPLQGEARLVLVRPAEPGLELLRRRETLAVLGAFCLLSAALAAAVSQGVIRAERLAMLGRLATGLAHEIHNPLSAIRLHAQMLETAAPGELAKTVAESAPVLVDESGRIEALVNQWMFLARPEPPGTRTLALAPVVERVLRNQRALAAHARVSLRSSVDAKLCVAADERRLAQAMGNLILNAIQAMPDGGEVTVSAEERVTEVRLAICDGGTGFSPAALARHRELFFSEKEGGMGVGLSVVAEIVEAHGGRLEIANLVAGGAAVYLYLPKPPPKDPLPA